ncbi:MAG: Bug family tripartite tricarboxylate transporter substrate binding protein [Pseudolabrys sp.]
MGRFEPMLTARRGALAGLAAAALLALAPAGTAQAKWPEKPIKIVLPFGAGGVADVTARIMADKLGDKLGQRVVIENMPGPGGISAARAVITSPPDGYTFALVTNGTAISVAAFKALPFDPLKDFEPVSMVGTFDLVFVVNAQSEYKTLGDFIKAAQAQPGKLNIGTIAVGGTQNLGAELFKSSANLNLQIVPYKNSPDIVVALLRNDVQMLVEFPPAVRGQVADGKLRILATSSPKPSPVLPNVPTVDQAGVKGFEVVSWNAIGAPKGTPKEIVDAMNKAMHEVLAMPEVKEAFAKVGVEAHASTPAELTSRLTADIKKWNAVIDKAGIPRK